MNILIPDNWLREFLKTKATPQQIKEYVSLCGPSVERIHGTGKDTVYDIEVTGNRPDAMSVSGIAREAAAILPTFGIAASFTNDPYTVKKIPCSGPKKLTITTDPMLNPRWTSVILTNVRVGTSPSWLQKWLGATGIRSLNTVVDITNYLMRSFGQPVHAFDYDEIRGAQMHLRASRKGEKIVTLDGKTHLLPGGDIVIADGDGRLIDLCGIMGGYNSAVKKTTRNVVLFTQTYNPVNIRRTSMALSHRTDAGSLFEKGIDTELTLPTLLQGIHLLTDLAGAQVASIIYDKYPKPFTPYTVSCPEGKLSAYIGASLGGTEIKRMLTPLGFTVSGAVNVRVPSWRRDVSLDVDVIEEVARMYGYHRIRPVLPSSPPPPTVPEAKFAWEYEIKLRLRDWGFTEIKTYSMISGKQMDAYHVSKQHAYTIANPLSEAWVFMRPTLVPGMMAALQENGKHAETLKLFELGMVYGYSKGGLPDEVPMLLVAWTGHHYREARGIADVFGISGGVSETEGVTLLYAPVADVMKTLSALKTYVPIPKYPPVYEDFSFIVPPDFRVGPFIDVIKNVHKLITRVELLDAFGTKRTFRVTYSDPAKTLTNLLVAPVHQKILEYAAEKFGVSPVI